MRFKTAKNYNEFAYSQKFVAKNLINELAKKKYENVYEIGCGSGLLTTLFLENFECEKLILNDIYKSDFMIDLTSKFEKFKPEISLCVEDIKNVNLPSNLDLVISSSVFQWLDKTNEFENLIDKIYHSLKNGGIFAFSMFVDGNLAKLTNFTKQSLNYKTSTQILDLLKNFKLINVQNGVYEVKFNDLKELLNHLKQTGVNNLEGDFKLTKTNFKLLEKHFNQDFCLSYNFINVICQKVV